VKNNRHGQAAIFSDADYVKVRRSIVNKKHRLLFDIARYTGERWGAIVQLQSSDVFDDNGVRSHITFRAITRKASVRGIRTTRQVPVHPELREILEKYGIPKTRWLFPSPVDEETHITLRAADLMLRGAVERAYLAHKGYSTHSTRRTFITTLYRKGVDIHTIQLITGHQDLKSLIRYIEVDPERTSKAIALL
jgi:integrase/recombinase XerD